MNEEEAETMLTTSVTKVRMSYYNNRFSFNRLNRNDLTRFSGYLAWELSRMGARETRPFLMATPKDLTTPEAWERAGILHEHREWLVDICVVDRTERSKLHIPILGCESETCESQDTSYHFHEPGARSTYVWDFRKLLFFQAPRLLFVALTKSRINGLERREKLKETLRSCAADYADFWKSSELYVVIFSFQSSRTEEAGTDLGVGINGKALHFSTLPRG